MNDHELILKLIEEVDPADTAKLDEIDARVWCYLMRVVYEYHETRELPRDYGYDFAHVDVLYVNGEPMERQYTRSRDALKAIRPEGWDYACSYTAGKWAELWKSDNAWRCVAKELPTEELAELHAIIQAIAWERAQK